MTAVTLTIVTPERVLLEEQVYQATLPIFGGAVTILPQHIPYIGALAAGEIVIRRAPHASAEYIATSGGFVEFQNNRLTILADTAERAEEIDLERAEAARARAEALSKERSTLDDEEYARVAASLERAMARLRVARKHRSHRGNMSEPTMP